MYRYPDIHEEYGPQIEVTKVTTIKELKEIAAGILEEYHRINAEIENRRAKRGDRRTPEVKTEDAWMLDPGRNIRPRNGNW